MTTATAEPTQTTVFGHCRDVAVNDGKPLDAAASAFHDLCPGAVWSPGAGPLKFKPSRENPNPPHVGAWTYCGCECHRDNPKCAECKRSGVALRDDQPTCLDVEDCHDYLATKTAAHPLTPMLAEVRAVADQERARKNAEKAAARRADDAPRDSDGDTPRPRKERAPRPARPPRPTSGRCIHCGESTKGGLFVAGHDAKLKGILLAAAKGGDVEALAEIIYRNWLKSERMFDPKVLSRARSLASHDGIDTMIERRVKERMDPPAPPPKKRSRAKAAKP